MPRSIAAVTLLLSLVAAPNVQAQFTKLTSQIPGQANTLILMDVASLERTPLAVKEGWRKTHEERFQSGMVLVPPNTTKFAGAAKLDFDTMTPSWQLAVVELDYDPNMAKVAVQYNGTVDRIADRDVVVLPGSSYGIHLMPKMAAIGAPAKRQDVARWLSQLDAGKMPPLSGYLKEAQQFAETSSPFILAMDLSEIFPAAVLRYRLGRYESLKGKQVDLDALSKAVASIRGVSLGISVGDRRTGAIKIDFENDISLTKGFAKELVLEALDKRGMMIEEFQDWEVQVTSKQILLTGTLYQSGQRRILSLIDTPVSLRPSEPAKSLASKVDPNDPKYEREITIAASQGYFKSVASLLDDLRRNKSKRKTMGQLSVWFRNYARKIDTLPILHVDSDMLGYGKYVSESLRSGGSSVTDAAARSRVRQQQVPTQYNVSSYGTVAGVNRRGVYGWGGWRATADPTATQQARTQVRTQERLTGVRSANQVLQDIENAEADVRRHMTAKYKVEF